MKIDFHHDFETRSLLDIKVVGSVKYAEHESTEVTLLTYAFGRTGQVKYWAPHMPFPPELIDVILNPHKYKFIAWNIMFDYLIWTLVLRKHIPYFNIVRPALADLEDAMALSCNFRTGAKLESASKILQLGENKDKEGRKIMLKMAKPTSRGIWYNPKPHEWAHFVHYGLKDTHLLREAYYRMPQLPPAERYAWEWTFRRNLRGIRVDLDLLNTFDAIIKQNKPKLEAEFASIVGPDIKINSPVACLKWFKPYYPHMMDMKADTVRDTLEGDYPVHPLVRRALELKDLAGSTSISKVANGLASYKNGRLYGLFAYAYAQTKRWAGRGIQIHNFPATPSEKDNKGDPLDFNINVPDLATTVRSRMFSLTHPIDFVKNLLRRIWLPDEGKVLYCGDFAKIEPTVLFWLTGMGKLGSKWYEEMASTIYNMTLEQVIALGKDSLQRAVGKFTNLGCGYGMGWKKFRKDTKKKGNIDLSEEMAKTAVHAYRNKYRPVTKLWKDLEQAFKDALNRKVWSEVEGWIDVAGVVTALCDGKIHVMPMQAPFKGVMIRLPSGSYLYYHHAAIREGSFWNEEEEKWEKKVGISYISDENGVPSVKFLYGGLLTEHVTSATARDILNSSIYNLEQANFDVLACVHDEVWAQDVAGRTQEFEDTMCLRPSWCRDLEILVESKVGVRYLK